MQLGDPAGRCRGRVGGRADDAPEGFLISDGLVFHDGGGAANPTLTIVALAIRQAEHMVGEMKAGAL